MKGGFFIRNGKLVIKNFIHQLFFAVLKNPVYLVVHPHILKIIIFPSIHLFYYKYTLYCILEKASLLAPCHYNSHTINRRITQRL